MFNKIKWDTDVLAWTSSLYYHGGAIKALRGQVN